MCARMDEVERGGLLFFIFFQSHLLSILYISAF